MDVVREHGVPDPRGDRDFPRDEQAIARGAYMRFASVPLIPATTAHVVWSWGTVAIALVVCQSPSS